MLDLTKMNKTLTLAAGLLLATGAHALTVEDYCDIKTARPKGVKEMTPMPDGQTYAAVSDDEKAIELFSYKTGEKTGELFNINEVKGEIKISEFNGYTLSDNGKKILLWNEIKGIYRYSFTAEYYVYDIMRKTLAHVSEGGPQRGAVMSHDGRMVAYVRDNNVYISNLDYGTDRAITEDGKINSIINGAPDWTYEEEFGVLNTIIWSGDDNVLAFIRFDESNVPAYSFDDYKGYCDEGHESAVYPQSYTYKYPLPGYPNSVVSVLAYELNNRVTKKMDIPMSDTDYIPSMKFDGTGKFLMTVVLNRDQNKMKLYKVNPGSTVAHEVLTEESKGWLSPSAYEMTHYYNDFFVIASERSGYRHLYRYNYDGMLLGQISQGDFNITEYYGYDAKKQLHYVQTTSLGAINRSVASVDNNGKLKLLTGKEGTELANWSFDFSYWLRNWSDAQNPPVYSLMTSDGKELKVIQDNESYKSKYAAAPKMEFLKVKNNAGEEMNAFIIKPANFDPSKKYPLMMYQYNGPDSQEVLNKWRMEGIFYIASQGYIVCTVDGRGTGNRDRAWAYAVYKDLGHYETIDQITAARYFGSLPYVDENRLSCFGWSYGGYMTLMELQAKDSPFKCGISMAPVTDWRFYDSIYTERFMLTPQQNQAGYDRASALNGTSGLKVPLLIMSGTNDDNVHFYNTLKYTSKLNYEGILFDMMAYTGFDHSLRMCNARVQLFRKIVSFLNTNL